MKHPREAGVTNLGRAPRCSRPPSKGSLAQPGVPPALPFSCPTSQGPGHRASDAASSAAWKAARWSVGASSRLSCWIDSTPRCARTLRWAAPSCLEERAAGSDWNGPDGEPKQVSCRVALLQLHRRGLIKLPEPQAAVPRARDVRGSDEGRARIRLPARWSELGGLRVALVTRFERELNEDWKRLMAHHYLGPGPLVGAQMRYLIGSERGWVGALAFSAAAWHVAARDGLDWLEQSEPAGQTLRYVVSNSRFLIPPWVAVPNLASRVLSLCVGRLREDWLERYGYEPVLLETFVDRERFRGTCYQGGELGTLGRDAGARTSRPRNDLQASPSRTSTRCRSASVGGAYYAKKPLMFRSPGCKHLSIGPKRSLAAHSLVMSVSASDWWSWRETSMLARRQAFLRHATLERGPRPRTAGSLIP